MRLFSLCFIAILLFPCGSAMMTIIWSVLAISISLYCQTLLFPGLCITQICFAGFIRTRTLLPIFEGNTNFHRDLFIIINTRVYPYFYIYALEVLSSATDISAREIECNLVHLSLYKNGSVCK